VTSTRTPPFRADHVGSLLRPAALLRAREAFASGQITREALRRVEDDCIQQVVEKQETIGLRSITDGEFRRTYFHVDFLERLAGVAVQGGIEVRFRSKQGDVDFAPPRLAIVDKLRHTEDIQRADFDFLESVVVAGVPKVTIPSPTMAHFRGGRAAIDIDAYPDLEEFFADLARCYREEIDSLYRAGCRYLQLDDTNLAYLCDPKLREGAKARGDDPSELPRTYAALINAALAGRPADLVVGIHLCRGNFRSAWVAEGSYEPVAEILFNELDVDAYFLEYDDERSGDFAPLRFVPRTKRVILGLVSSKVAGLEPQSELIRRVHEAAVYVPIENLGLSPQCGFSSTVHGNQVSADEQWAKLEHVVKTAKEIWGEA